MVYNNELLEKLSKRIYVFMYKQMDMDDYHITVEDGAPVRLTEKELSLFADAWVKNGSEKKLEFAKLPKALREKITDAVFDSFEKEHADDECSLQEEGLMIDAVPVELELALQELTKTAEEEELEWPEPSKDNSLYLTIKQIYFDQIASGEKKAEYREIKDTTYKKYLEVDEDGNPLLFTDKFHEGEEYDIDTYNGGECALVPKDSIYYLNLAVGYAKERDTMLVKVVDFSFAPAKDTEGNDFIFDWDEENGMVLNPNGKYTRWVIAFHLGEIVDLHRK